MGGACWRAVRVAPTEEGSAWFCPGCPIGPGVCVSFLASTIVAPVSAIVVTAKMLGKYRGWDQHKALRFIIFVGLAAIASTVYLTLEAAARAALYLWVGA